jgi:MFS family permease
MRRLNSVALSGLVALAVAMGIGRFAFTPILPMMQADAGIGLVEGGWLASANYVGYLLGALSAVSLRFPASLVIRAGLAAVGLTTLAMGFTMHLAGWLALRLLAGVASAWVLVFASAWCLEWFEANAPAARRPLLGATLFAGVGTGIAAAGALCLVLILRGQSSAAAWSWLGAIALVAAALLPGFGSRVAAPAAIQSGGTGDGATRLILCYGAFGFGYIIPATFISTMARDLVRDPSIYGWAWPLFGVAAALSTFAAALLRRRWSDRWLWVAGHVIMALGVATPLVLGGIIGIVASALLVGGTFMAVTMVGMQEARREAGAGARRLMAAMTAAFAAGQIAGPLVVSALAALGSGYAASLLTAAALLVLSALALIPNAKEKTP